MDTKRTVIRGFCREECPTPIYEEEHFIPVEDEENQDSINITWLIWSFAIGVFLILAVATTSLVINIQTKNKIDKIEQYYEQKRS